MDEFQIKTDAQDFNKQYNVFIQRETTLPDILAQEYDVVSCLVSCAHSEIFKIQSKSDGEIYILKVTDDSFNNERHEDDVLREINHHKIPKLIVSINQGGKLYIIREYFEGQTIADIVTRGRSFTNTETIFIALQLCEILDYLHNRPKPIIYRDLKPQNIIISSDGIVKLIDFDIARRYEESANTDTQYYGTKEFSPPEQFGYTQTDARTDVYALGVLMVYMLIGSVDLNRINFVENKRLRKIITRCTQFAPKDRYPNMYALKENLVHAQKSSRLVRIRHVVAAVFLSAVCLTTGFFAGLFYEKSDVTSLTEVYSENAIVKFESPLIYKAVCLALEKAPNDPIYYYELAKVENIRIWGNEVYDSNQPLYLGYDKGFTNVHVYFGGYNGESQPVERGGITSLKEISLLKNLKELDIVMQGITDLYPLEGLTLERLNIAGNQVTDLSPLSKMDTLVHINLDFNPVADITPLASLTYLINFSASDTLIEDVSPLAMLHHLDYLYINNARVKDVSALAGLKLTNCFLQNNRIEDISMLNVSEILSTDCNPATD